MAKINVKISDALNKIGRESVDALLPEVLAAKEHLLKGDAAIR